MGSELNEIEFRIPDSNNLYGVIKSDISKVEIAKEFEKVGWKIRKSSWTDIECKCAYAELELIGKDEVLIQGRIDKNELSRLQDVLVMLHYSVELYNDENEVIKTVANTLS